MQTIRSKFLLWYHVIAFQTPPLVVMYNLQDQESIKNQNIDFPWIVYNFLISYSRRKCWTISIELQKCASKNRARFFADYCIKGAGLVAWDAITLVFANFRLFLNFLSWSFSGKFLQNRFNFLTLFASLDCLKTLFRLYLNITLQFAKFSLIYCCCGQ